MSLYEINQSNQNGDNKVEILDLEIDVEWVRNIIYNEKEKIINVLSYFKDAKKQNGEAQEQEIEIMFDIDDKNKKNELEKFYDKYIKEYENEMDVLYNFFKDEEKIDEIDEASENIKMAIYSITKSEKLTPKIFNIIIQKHTKSIADNKDKKLMKLFIFFLYRHCFIGEV